MPLFKTIINRTFVFYLACIFVVLPFLDYNKLYRNALGETMSRLTPPMNYLRLFAFKQGPYSPYRLRDCIYYHKKVIEYFPYQKAEALAMQAYCTALLGKSNEALDLYKQSLAINGDYFWPYYDAGILSYQKRDYASAVKYLSSALEQNPLKTLYLLPRSKVYSDVYLSDNEYIVQFQYAPSLKNGRRNSYVLLMDCLLKAHDYQRLLSVAMTGVKEGFEDETFYYYARMASLGDNNPEAMMLQQKLGPKIEQEIKEMRVQFF